jgi:hypothetical protein
MTYDSRRQQVVLLTGNDLHTTTWTWDGTNWTAHTPATCPTPRDRPVIAYDKAHDQVVMFGGIIYPFNFQYDTWVWDGTNWANANPTSHPVNIGDMTRMAFDEARNELVLFGGRDIGGRNETWTWKGTNWEQRFPAHTPGGRGAHGMAYDSIRREIVLFGGEVPPYQNVDTNDTWSWNGADWQRKSPVVLPEARESANMAFDTARGIVIMQGGTTCPPGAPSCTLFTNVWVWDGGNWQSYGPNSCFPPVPKLTIEVSEFTLCWNSDLISMYQVQYRSDLTTNAWTNLGPPVQGNGSTNCITDRVAGPRRFYRVVALPCQ